MTLDVPNWKHKSGHRINVDGQAIEYEHTEMPWEAAIVGIAVESEENPFDFQYFVVIDDVSTSNPIELIEGHEFFVEKENAMKNLESKMKKHS